MRSTRNRAAADALGNNACKAVAAVAPRLSAGQKRILVNAYAALVNAMTQQGWLTPAQAATLNGLADAL